MTQWYVDDGKLGGFGEIEYHAPALDASRKITRIEDRSETWAFESHAADESPWLLNQPAPLSSANWYSGFYVQDDWKVTPKLSLNIGLRYDINFPRTESQNRTSIFDPYAPSPLVALSPQFALLRGAMMYADDRHRAYAPTELHDFAPRFGLAYRIDSSTVVRAGYGIFYGLSPTAAVLTQGGYLDGFSATTSIITSLDGVTPIVSLSNPFPDGITPTATRSQLSASTLLGQAVNSVNIGQATPYIQNWNFSLQHSFGSSLLLQVAYAGSKGTRLPLAATLDVNSLTTAQYELGAVNNQLVPNPFYGYITDPTSILSKGCSSFRFWDSLGMRGASQMRKPPKILLPW